MDIKLAVKERALALGFDLVGIAPLPSAADLEFHRQWLEKGYGGEMHYLANPRRDDPRQLLPSVKSIVCAGLIYNAPYPYSTEVASSSRLSPRPLGEEGSGVSGFNEAEEHSARDAAPRGWISRYGWGADYHATTRQKLEQLRTAIEDLVPGVETRVYVDTGPLVERAVARLSGIGWMGKNTCLINEGKGSWFFLGVILTNLELGPDIPAPDRCGSCTRCLDACPTGALVEPYVMDASRCIAYFNIELKGAIPQEFRTAIGANVFGCDICQDVCPWNNRPSSVASNRSQSGDTGSRVSTAARRVPTTTLPEFQPMRIETMGKASQAAGRGLDEGAPAEPFSLFNPSLQSLASFSEDDFRRVFAHSPIKRVKFRGWIRNLCVAMGNSGDRRFVPWLARVAEHPDAMLREHAEWALKQLGGEGN